MWSFWMEENLYVYFLLCLCPIIVGEDWDLTNRFNPVTLMRLSQDTWSGNQTLYVVVILYVQWFEVRSDCSLCWYWQNYCSPLFKPSFLSGREMKRIPMHKNKQKCKIVFSIYLMVPRVERQLLDQNCGR